MNYFWTSDLKNIKLQDNQQFKIVFNDLERCDSKKLIKGKWSFEFTASGEKLRVDKKSIPVNKYFILEGGGSESDGRRIVINSCFIGIHKKIIY
ncbi:hypothetical protein CJ195_11925 [Bacillus sp. UMB0899]|nr:hypothetical protein CJ195_11925 [Bacillus sp. UMB0899]